MQTRNDDEGDYTSLDKGLYKSLCFMPISYCLYSHERFLSGLPVLHINLSPCKQATEKHIHENCAESLTVHTYSAMVLEIENCIHIVREIRIIWGRDDIESTEMCVSYFLRYASL